jgi:Arc/MetJ-type ribon-helix-helix transcriptional regulator
MIVQLKPELEALIKKDVERGPYRSIDEFVEQAITELHEREQWLASHREEIRLKIDEGWAAAERGELLTEAEARREMQEMKTAWRAKHPRSA